MTRRLICAGVILVAMFARSDSAPLSAAPPVKKAVRDPVAVAIQNGVRFLRQRGIEHSDIGLLDQLHRLGKACLVGLALLESGVPANDPMIREITNLVMQHALENYETYEVSLVLMFLDRLGNKADVPLIQYLGVRLLTGQGADGTWTYTFAHPLPQDAKDLVRLQKALTRTVQVLRTAPKAVPKDSGTTPRDDLPTDGGPKKDKSEPKKEAEPPPQPEKIKLHVEAENALKYYKDPARKLPGGGDHSNTQFGSVGLWVARKYGVPVDDGLAALDRHYRKCQSADGGWGYTTGSSPSPQMTAAGLIGLIVAVGARETSLRSATGGLSPDTLLPKKGGANDGPDLGKDEAITKGLSYLGKQLQEAVGPLAKDDDPKKPRRHYRGGSLGTNYYMLWSVERVAVTYGLKTIGNVDWYSCSAEALIAKQQKEGNWGTTPVDTAFALLVLTKANFASDLTDAVRGRVRDPDGTELSSIEPDSVPKVIGKGKIDDPPANVDDDAKAFSAEADRLANAVAAAAGEERERQIAKLRDSKGAIYTEALLRAIRRLNGEGLKQARDALAIRLTRMTAATLREMLKDRDSELRRAAALACAMKEDRGLVPDLITALADKEGLIIRAVRAALKALTKQDFGPETESAADITKAQTAWREWWNKNGQK